MDYSIERVGRLGPAYDEFCKLTDEERVYLAECFPETLLAIENVKKQLNLAYVKVIIVKNECGLTASIEKHIDNIKPKFTQLADYSANVFNQQPSIFNNGDFTTAIMKAFYGLCSGITSCIGDLNDYWYVDKSQCPLAVTGYGDSHSCVGSVICLGIYDLGKKVKSYCDGHIADNIYTWTRKLANFRSVIYPDASVHEKERIAHNLLKNVLSGGQIMSTNGCELPFELLLRLNSFVDFQEKVYKLTGNCVNRVVFTNSTDFNLYKFMDKCREDDRNCNMNVAEDTHIVNRLIANYPIVAIGYGSRWRSNEIALVFNCEFDNVEKCISKIVEAQVYHPDYIRTYGLAFEETKGSFAFAGLTEDDLDKYLDFVKQERAKEN